MEAMYRRMPNQDKYKEWMELKRENGKIVNRYYTPKELPIGDMGNGLFNFNGRDFMPFEEVLERMAPEDQDEVMANFPTNADMTDIINDDTVTEHSDFDFEPSESASASITPEQYDE